MLRTCIPVASLPVDTMPSPGPTFARTLRLFAGPLSESCFPTGTPPKFHFLEDIPFPTHRPNIILPERKNLNIISTLFAYQHSLPCLSPQTPQYERPGRRKKRGRNNDESVERSGMIVEEERRGEMNRQITMKRVFLNKKTWGGSSSPFSIDNATLLSVRYA